MESTLYPDTLGGRRRVMGVKNVEEGEVQRGTGAGVAEERQWHVWLTGLGCLALADCQDAIAPLLRILQRITRKP